MKYILFIISLICTSAFAQKKFWTVEAEDPASTVTWNKDASTGLGTSCADIIAPKGLTLWYNREMKGNTVIEYEARIVSDPRFKDKDGNIRISDLNCFWMASEGAKGSNGSSSSNGSRGSDDSPLKSIKQRDGKFLNSYTMQLYYMGYGGNWNTTTRFRRYDGDRRGVTDPACRPRILKEYTDAQHLLKPDHWYHIRLEQTDGRIRYYIDGELLVDYLDPQPLTSGYFGFRTTLSHAQLRNFRYTSTDPDAVPIALHWIGSQTLRNQAPQKLRNTAPTPVTFGVPFSKGEKKDDSFTLTTADGTMIPCDTWRLASWPDGSAKWQAFAAVIPAGTDSCLLSKTSKSSRTSKTSKSSKSSSSSKTSMSSKTSSPLAFTMTLNSKPCRLLKVTKERQGNVRTTYRYDFDHATVRSYHYVGSNEVKLVHTLFVDSALNKSGLSELSLHFKVPMHGKSYERFIQFDDRRMSVQPLISRRKIDRGSLQMSNRDSGSVRAMDKTTQHMLKHIAQWDGFRLSQLSPNGYSVRKRATSISPWIGTIEGQRSNGFVAVGDSTSCTSFRLEDFWQSYPSTLQVDDARSDSATVSICLYSPEAERYSFEHYDTIAHDLEASYEDVQPGMSTAWGIARTSTVYINTTNDRSIINNPAGGYSLFINTTNDRSIINNPADDYSLFTIHYSLFTSPQYLHRKRAFGIWSLPTVETPRDREVEDVISGIMSMYEHEIERNGWYGFINYGDVMHAYDDTRGQWRYDVGGYAWDNTELGSPAMFWYAFLRSGDPRIWRMATAMTRHCSEVDTYHSGPHAGLGSRHNVIHWGCGAKEARIAEAWWNHFMYYLTADERLGDIMHEVVNADTLLYHLDPMRLAQPRGKYPCTAPARLRLGPDWFGYASNWQMEIERGSSSKCAFADGQNAVQSAKLFAGMNSIAGFRHGFFEGPKALGYDPATGIITNESDSTVQNTNHLMTIMGGFELMNELEEYYRTENGKWGMENNGNSREFSFKPFFKTWLDFCAQYKQKAWTLSHNKFLIPRLQAYAAWRLGDPRLAASAWKDLLNDIPSYKLNQHQSSDPSSTQPGAVTKPKTSVTNDCATWILDAIFMKEVLR